MTDSPAPALTSHDFHPDHPGPIGWLIYSLHTRLAAVEAKLNIDAFPAEAKTVAAKVESSAESALHVIEDALHIKHD